MTTQRSFSTLLQAKLDEDNAEAVKARNAAEQQQWLERVNNISNWLQKVFADDSFVLLGYKLKKRIKSRQGDHFLTVYVRVGNVVFGLETSQNNGRYRANIGICVLRTGRSGVSSQLFKLQQIYKENNFLNHLSFEADFSDLNSQPITRGSAQGVTARKQLCEQIVAATVNVAKRRPEQLSDSTARLIVADLPKHKNMHMSVSDSETMPSAPVPTQNVEEYLANIPSDILSMALGDFIPIPDNENAAKEREKSLECLSPCGLLWVRDILRVDYSALQEWGKNQYWATRAIVEELAKYDLELVPPTGSEYLPQGVPKTVNQLLNKSGLKGVERPRNCLGRAQIVTTQQLLLQTESDLLALTNFGQKSLQTLNAALAQYSLKLASE